MKLIMKNILITIGIFFLITTNGVSIGIDKFLNEGVSVKGDTMGGTYSGIENSVSVINYNPAAATLINSKNIEINYSGNTVSDINNIMIGYGERINNKVAYGINISREALGGYEEYGYDMSTTGMIIDSKKIGLCAGTGINIISRLSAGISLKILNKEIGGYSGTGFGIDTGIYWKRKEKIKKHSIIENLIYNIEGGISVKNILGPSIKLRNEIEEEPLEIRVAAGYTFNLLNLLVNKSGVRIMAEGIYRNDIKEINYVYGMELMIIKEISLLLGYGENMFRAGISINIRNIEFNYGYKNNIDIGGTHNIGIKILLNENKEEKSIGDDEDITEIIKRLPLKERKKVKEHYFNGLDNYYRGDKINAIAEWKKIDTTNKKLREKINQLIQQVEDEILK